jgi:hypothetical protein
MRIIAHGVTADYMDEYHVNQISSPLCEDNDLYILREVSSCSYWGWYKEVDGYEWGKGWLGMLGSIECMHSMWKTARAWHSQYSGHQPIISIQIYAWSSGLKGSVDLVWFIFLARIFKQHQCSAKTTSFW